MSFRRIQCAKHRLLPTTIGLVLAVGAWASAGQNPPSASPDTSLQTRGSGCLGCHNSIAKVLEKKEKHAAVESGCETCHLDHNKLPDPAAQRTPVAPHYLNEKEPELCLACHQAGDSAIIAAHKGQPFAHAECTGCHDPHASSLPKLGPENAHAPYEARDCDTCHKAPQDGKVQLVTSGANDLCYTCHDDLKKQIDGARSKHSLIELGGDSCVECHNPHATSQKHALKKPVEALCNSCHAGMTQGKAYIHEPVKVSCILCHDPHAAPFPKNLYAGIQDLCLGCHGPNAVKIVQGSQPVAIFDGRVTLPARSFEDLEFLQLDEDGKKGHPFPGHPVLIQTPSGKGGMNCLTCHLAHAANGSRALLVTEDANTNAICMQCHK